MYKTLVCNSISCPTALQSRVSPGLLWNIDGTLAFVASCDTLNIRVMFAELQWICSDLDQQWLQREQDGSNISPYSFLLASFLFPFSVFFLTTQRFEAFLLHLLSKINFLKSADHGIQDDKQAADIYNDECLLGSVAPVTLGHVMQR